MNTLRACIYTWTSHFISVALKDFNLLKLHLTAREKDGSVLERDRQARIVVGKSNGTMKTCQASA